MKDHSYAWTYFDYSRAFRCLDVSIDILNGVILNPPPKGDAADAEHPWTIEDNGVKPEFCLPPPVAPLSVSVGSFGWIISEVV